MPLKLFEFVGTDPSCPFSLFCWRRRIRCFTGKTAIAPHGSERVPVLLDDRAVIDSWTTANYLEGRYPNRPSLFGGKGGRAMARMLTSAASNGSRRPGQQVRIARLPVQSSRL